PVKKPGRFGMLQSASTVQAPPLVPAKSTYGSITLLCETPTPGLSSKQPAVVPLQVFHLGWSATTESPSRENTMPSAVAWDAPQRGWSGAGDVGAPAGWSAPKAASRSPEPVPRYTRAPPWSPPPPQSGAAAVSTCTVMSFNVSEPKRLSAPTPAAPAPTAR